MAIRTKLKPMSLSYVDTVILIKEFVGNPPTSPRALKAIARMNFLHSQYISRGQITQPGLLYTLSVFVTEPINWINKCEWRQLTDMEICAFGTFWKGIGDAMGIDYSVLKHYGNWKDGIEFYEDVRDWAAEYEDEFREPAESNMKVANSTVAVLLTAIPTKLKHLAFQLLCALMEDEVRSAMTFVPLINPFKVTTLLTFVNRYERPPKIFYSLASLLISTRRFLLTHVFLPRPIFLKDRIILDTPNPKTGRYLLSYWYYNPFYVRSSLWNRWGPRALLCRTLGLDIPGMKPEIYKPDGYLFEEVGPTTMRGKGVEAMRKTEEMLSVERTGGCPFYSGR